MDNVAGLRSLMAAARDGSLSAAARRLKITQPAVSQQIAALEQLYGVELVVRGRNGVRLTEAGQVAVTHAEQVLAQLARMDDAMFALQSSEEGRLSVACPSLIAKTVLVPVLADLRRSYPKIKIDLKATDQLQDPIQNPYDLELRACRIGPAEGSIRKLAEIEQVLIASPGYLDRVGRPESLDGLSKLDYIQFKDDPDEKFLPLADGAQAPITIAFAAQMPDLMLHAVQNHLGIAALPRFFVSSQLEAGIVEEVLPTHPLAAKQLFLVRAPGTLGKSRRVAIFMDRFVEELANAQGFSLVPGLKQAVAAVSIRRTGDAKSRG
jgi:DNA-binding transcriptional LysR family regulator